MKEQNPILSNERYIDLLTELVLEQEEENELSELTNISDSEINMVSGERAKSVWQDCRLLIRKSKGVSTSKDKTKKVLARIINIAACVVLLVCMIFPVVLASNAQLRKNVYKLIIDMQPSGVEISMDLDEDQSFDVPSDWEGEYFPTRIPEGFAPTPIGNSGTLDLWDDSNHMITLEEKDPQSRAWIDTNGATMEPLNLNGKSAFLFEKTYQDGRKYHTAVVNLEDRYFIITTMNMTRTETVDIAGSIRRVSGN